MQMPDVAGWIDGQLSAIRELKGEAVDWIAQHTADPELATSLLDQVDAQCQQMAASARDAIAPADGEQLGQALSEPLEKSFDELNRLLPEGWTRKTGLKMVSARDGTTEWVLSKDAENFARRGAALLHERATPPPKVRAGEVTTTTKQVAGPVVGTPSASSLQPRPATQQGTTRAERQPRSSSSSNAGCCWLCFAPPPPQVQFEERRHEAEQGADVQSL